MSDYTMLSLIGHPVGHSKSPMIFKKLREWTGKDHSYSLIDIDENNLDEFFEFAKKNSISGFNVTIPHKESITDFCDDLSSEVKVTGACNVVAHVNGQFKAMNTDVSGFRESFNSAVSKILNKTPDKVYLFGAGGAARAVIAGLQDLGVKDVYVGSRSEEKAEKLISDFSPFLKNTSLHLAKDENEYFGSEVFINATPVGLDGFESDLEFLMGFKNLGLVFDLVYESKKSPLREKAIDLKIPYMDGTEMLCYQALESWEIWFNEKLDKEKFCRRLKSEFKEASYGI
jgi:shikimate dehydrogenase